MPKLQLNATELVNPDVDIVAMVKRGANRIPFRVTKKDDDDMIDLSKLGASLFSKSSGLKAPTVSGVILAKGADATALLAVLKEAGLDVEVGFVKAESDQATTFTKTDVSASEETLILKLSDEVAVAIAGPADLIKRVSGYDWDSTSFKEVLTKGTFAPSLCMAQDMLHMTFSNILEKADDRETLSTMIKTAVGEFSSYIDTLVTAVPDSIFKADKAMAKAKGKPADDMDEDDKMKKEQIASNPVHGNETDTTKPGSAASNDIEGSPAEGNETPTNPPTKNNGPGGAVSSNIEGKPAADDAKTSQPAQKSEVDTSVLDLLKGLGEQLKAGLAEVRTHVDTSVSTLKDEVTGLSAKVSKTEAALGGTVVGDAEGDRTGSFSKSATPAAPPLLDTAFMKHPSAKAA